MSGPETLSAETASADTPAGTNPFSKKTVLAMLAFGTLAFLALLFALGSGWDGRQDRNGAAHAGSNGLTGFTGLVSLLDAQGYDVSISRDETRMDGEALLILTPPQFTNAEELSHIISDRQYIGPTLIIMPKWNAFLLPDDERIVAEDGWVYLSDTWVPRWLGEMEYLENSALMIGKTKGWKGMGLSGDLAEPDKTQVVSQYRAETTEEVDEDTPAITQTTILRPKDGEPGNTDNGLIPMVQDSEGDILAAFRDDNGYYPFLSDEAGKVYSNDEVDDQEEGVWPVVFVFEPDLMNNYGLADFERARVAEQIIWATLDDYEMPITFDVTLNGLGQSENLLTLAFKPPFLAATLCLLFAALVIVWRSFIRFGPPLAQLPGFAKGKTALARNGAYLVERAKRLHLLGPPFANMVARRMAKTLSIHKSDMIERDEAIDEALIRTGYSGPTFTSSAAALRQTNKPQELLRAARALRTIERTLEQ